MTDEVVIPPVDPQELQMALRRLSAQVFGLQAVVAALITELTVAGSLAPTQMYDALSHWSNRLEEQQHGLAMQEVAALLGETSALLYEMLQNRGILPKGMGDNSAPPADLPDYMREIFEDALRRHEERCESDQ